MTQPQPAAPENKRNGALVLTISIALLLPAVFWMARPFFSAALIASILAVALDPLQCRVARLVRRTSLAALITTSLTVGTVLTAVGIVGWALHGKIRSGDLANFLSAAEKRFGSISLDYHSIEAALPEISRLAGDLFTAVFAAVFLYVLLVHGKTWTKQILELLPLETSTGERISAAIRDSIVANVDGILAMATVEAVLYIPIFAIAGISSPVMWGAFAGLSSMIPLLGAAAVWLPLSIRLAVHGAWVRGLLVGIVSLAAQQGVALVLVPRLVGARLRQAPLLIALSILGATSAFGAIGILLGPVIVSVFGALVHELRIYRHPDAVAQAGTGN